MKIVSALETMSTELVNQAAVATDCLTVEVVNLLDEFNNPLSKIRGEWQELYERDPDASIFHHPDYTGAELSFLPKTNLPSLIVVCRREGRIVGLGGLLPKISRSRYVGGVGPNLKLHGYRLIGNRFLTGGDDQVQARLLV